MSHSPNLNAKPAKGILKKNKHNLEDATRYDNVVNGYNIKHVQLI